MPQSGVETFEPDEVALVEELAGYLGRVIHRVKAPDLRPDEDEIAAFYARLTDTEVVDCDSAEWDLRLWEVVGLDAIERWRVLPLRKIDDKSIQGVMANPTDLLRRDAFEAELAQ